MGLLWFKNASELLARGKAQPSNNAVPLYQGPFALVNDPTTGGAAPATRDDLELVSSRMFKVTVGSDDYVSIIVCRINADEPEWAIYCGDTQVSGKERNDGKKLAASLRTAGAVNTKLSNAVEGSDWVARVPDQASCGFFRMFERSGKFCSHTETVLAGVDIEELDAMADEIAGWLSGAAVAATLTAIAPMSVEEAAFFDAAFVQHVLLAGERGSGKTFIARQAADRYEAVYLEMQMHASMEPWEFRAHDRSWNGKTYTVMGKLAEAVYWIQQGKRVVLCMDEFLNMNPVYATTINTPLTLTNNDTYLIETGRLIDQGNGIATLETVEVPSDMLWIVATSNIGARYGLDKMAPSARARFLIILMNTDPERTRKILEKNLVGYDMPLEFAAMFEKFIKACNTAVEENTLDEEATTRLACNVLRAVYKKAKRDKKSYSSLATWLPIVKQQLMLEVAQVVNFELGPLDEDQKALFKTTVDTCFK